MSLPRHIFLTGPPGVGKSTLVKRVLRRLVASVEVSGFITEERLGPEGRRVGFQSVDVADPCHVEQLATLDFSMSGTSVGGGDTRVGPFLVHVEEIYGFTVRALAAGRCAMGEKVADAPFGVSRNGGRAQRLVVLDEVGAMQLLSPGFQELLDETLGRDGSEDVCPCFGTLPLPGLHALPFVDRIRLRHDTTIIVVSVENSASLVDDVWRLLCRLVYPPGLLGSIEAKAALAQRYVAELPARVEGSNDRTCIVRFQGDHGVYLLDPPLREGGPRRCSCPFFGESGICSHSIALVLGEQL